MAVRVPELAEQDRILTVLGSLDDKIEINRRMNETLDAMAQVIFRDWFVDFGPTRRKMAGATDPVVSWAASPPTPREPLTSRCAFRTRLTVVICPRGGNSVR